MQSIDERLSRLILLSADKILQHGLVGLEKESLRVAAGGGIASTPHPSALGSALTHPWITTDYSEALLEFITPPFEDFRHSLSFLGDLHSYVYQKLDEELLWATSMPCVLKGDENIPVARYGSSHSGRMKHIYRLGLGYRYGRVMQVIAGVHYNYSPPERLWPVYQDVLGDRGPARRFRDDRYMGMIRNLQRYGWLIPYLFGASPAVCKSFLAGRGRSPNLQDFDESTYYEPYATSLRMGDIGYTNRREEGLGVKACYDNLEAYVDSLRRAIDTPAAQWQAIGVKVDGEYRQLSANLLQIENEYYSTVRPKQVLQGLEKPVHALHERGIRYVELRSLDVNAYHPLGMEECQLRFVEALMLYCLLADSPPIGVQESREINANFELVAHRGREPGLTLVRAGRAESLRQWAEQILQAMQGVCEQLDDDKSLYSASLGHQMEKVKDPEATPSARMLREMRDKGESFYAFAHRLSEEHNEYFQSRTLSPESEATLGKAAEDSLREQREREASDRGDFDSFLQAYLAQP